MADAAGYWWEFVEDNPWSLCRPSCPGPCWSSGSMPQEMESLLCSELHCDPPRLILALYHLQHGHLMTTPMRLTCTFSFAKRVSHRICAVKKSGTFKLVPKNLCRVFMGNLFFVKPWLATLGKKTSIFLFNQPGKGKCWCWGQPPTCHNRRGNLVLEL